jgi:hypothetical protein
MWTLVATVLVAGYVNEMQMPVGSLVECEAIGYELEAQGLVGQYDDGEPMFECQLAPRGD